MILLRVILLILVAGAVTTITLLSLQRRTKPGATSLLIFALALTLWANAYALSMAGVPPSRLFWIAFFYLGATVTPTALFTFVLEYTDHNYWLTRRNIAFLALEPAVMQILIWTDPTYGLSFVGKNVETYGTAIARSPWFFVNSIYTDGLVLVAIFLLVKVLILRPGVFRLQASTVLTGAIVHVFVNLISLFNLVPNAISILTPIAFTITGLTLGYGLVQYHLLDVFPVKWDVVFEGMKDGMMVLDTQNRIVGITGTTQAMINLPRDKIIGQPVENVLGDWQNYKKRFGKTIVLDTEKSVKMPDGWHTMNFRIQPLTVGDGRPHGHLLIWHDITMHRKVEEIRQRERDELLNLLHMISGAASRANSITDLLTESIRHIAVSFQSQSGVVFLRNDDGDESENPSLSLISFYEVSEWGVDSMSSILEESDMVSRVIKNKGPLHIQNIRDDPRVPPSMRKNLEGSLFIIPIPMEVEVQGVIGLLRKTGIAFSKEEISRLNSVAGEVAIHIQSIRKRQMEITLAERHRLERDLHDSLSQKLYSLVLLTEAALAGLKAEPADMPIQILSRIGETARKILKEMRLFLFELQPVNLERGGIVSLLHQRLEAVEGRTDIEAKFVVDEDVSISKQKQLALYFIAQEALNNVLRHSNAKSVSIRLQKIKNYILLEITDDGCGFNPKLINGGGKGLRNIQERAMQVGGKLDIQSAPGDGTTITVTIK